MSSSFKIGTRSSRLARIQTERAVGLLGNMVPACPFEIVTGSSPGDRDRTLDLRDSPPDFFTRDLDLAVLQGELDAAIHSAKDVPNPVPPGLDWVWLPWREDSRDVLVLAPGDTPANLRARPRVGVSSERRAVYARRRFPDAELVSLRGNIEARLRQLDEGICDVIIMAGAALLRLGLEDRITEWIPLAELAVPDGQGVLALTFRADDARFLRLRSLLVKPVTFVGAGVGNADLCTLAGLDALKRCDVCLHDSLFDPALLDHVPPDATRLDVGKRCGNHPVEQEAINELLSDYARRGGRVVRVKGGDPGLFGRLAEEVEWLEAAHLPYRVIPGVSSLNAATTATGMLLTRRDISPGFCVMTARGKGGSLSAITGQDRAKLPCVFFMGSRVAGKIAKELIRDGVPPEIPAALVFNACSSQQHVVRGILRDMEKADVPETGAPGLFLVGEIAKYGYVETDSALGGRRILLTCSETLLKRAVDRVRDLGGDPIPFPLIRLAPDPAALDKIPELSVYDWLVLPSPSAVRCLFSMLLERGLDVRMLPPIMVSGPATATELARFGLNADICPARNVGAEGLVAESAGRLEPGSRVLRLRSDRAGSELVDGLRAAGAEVTDIVLYSNTPIPRGELPDFHAAVFASGSAVEAFARQWGAEGLAGKITVAMGPPTEKVFATYGLPLDVTAHEATIEGLVAVLAQYVVNTAIEKIST